MPFLEADCLPNYDSLGLQRSIFLPQIHSISFESAEFERRNNFLLNPLKESKCKSSNHLSTETPPHPHPHFPGITTLKIRSHSFGYCPLERGVASWLEFCQKGNAKTANSFQRCQLLQNRRIDNHQVRREISPGRNGAEGAQEASLGKWRPYLHEERLKEQETAKRNVPAS